jgi:hypothetical protein
VPPARVRAAPPAPAPARLRLLRLGLGSRLCFRLGRRGRRAGAVGIADDGDHGADVDRVALLDADLGEHAGHRRRHLGVDLVGRHLEQRLVGSDGVTDLLEPLRDGALGDGFAELRERDVCHVRNLFFSCGRVIGCRVLSSR